VRKFDVLITRVLEEKYAEVEAEDPEKAVTMVVDHLTSPNGSPSTPIGEAFVDHWDNLELSFQRFIAAEVVDDEFTSAYDFVLSDDGLIAAKRDSNAQEEKVKQILQEALIDHVVELIPNMLDDYIIGFAEGAGIAVGEWSKFVPRLTPIEFVGQYDGLVRMINKNFLRYFMPVGTKSDEYQEKYDATIASIRPIPTKESEHEQKS
jgi:hypothetical protein